jgi:diguanylate cyclase (GGDEF)-like protein
MRGSVNDTRSPALAKIAPNALNVNASKTQRVPMVLRELPTSSDEADPALVASTLRDGFRLLRFPPALEHAYVRARGDERTVRLITAGMMGALALALFMWPDYLIDPQGLTQSLALRMGLYGGMSLVGLIMLHRLGMPQVNEWMVVPLTLLASLIAAFQTQADHRDIAFARIVEIVLVVAYATVFTRFWPMLLACILMLGVYMQTLLLAPPAADALKPGITLMLLTTIGFGLYTTYTRERNDRRAYLNELREQALRASVDAGNRLLQTMARTDALTGVANRRAFDDALDQHVALAPRRDLALLMVDVDHFKAYNDHYGHPAGDQCLRRVSEALASGLRRPIDLLARWGGEEFAILLSDADEAVACHVADRIGAAVRQQNMAHAASSCAPQVTVSIGVVLAPATQTQQAHALLQAADDALYQAKRSGRNRYVLHQALAPDAQPC